jgi:hypothetical protein
MFFARRFLSQQSDQSKFKMTMKKKHCAPLSMVPLMVALGSMRSNAFSSIADLNASGLGPDTLYVGDQGDNTVAEKIV